MKQKRDYYEILGVSKLSSTEEIKTKYRQLAHMYHPDKNLGSTDTEELFKEATEAYAVLSDSKKRANYDKFGHDWYNSAGHTGVDIFDDFLGNIVEDFFNSKSSKTKEKGKVKVGADLRFKVLITLEESLFGCVRDIKFRRRENCTVCCGSGMKKGVGISICKRCLGSGLLKQSHGFFVMTEECSTCSGSGHNVQDMCINCQGSGRALTDVDLTIVIPKGIGLKDVVRMVGDGDIGTHGGKRGDLYICVALMDHAIFKKKDLDIYCDKLITFVEAALGAFVTVPTLYGEETIEIPTGTQSGHLIKLEGKGLPKLINSQDRGDQFVRVVISIPKDLTGQQKDVLRHFELLTKS